MWIGASLEDVVARDDAFEAADGPHQLVAEVAGAERALGIRLSLQRRGWTIRSPEPVRLRLAPWIATVAGVLGALSLRWFRRVGAGLLVAGVLAQALLASVPWPPPVRGPELFEGWTSGPLGLWVRDAALALPDNAVAIGAGLVALCLMLVAFDHRRSRRKGGTLLASGLMGAMGLVAWIEVAWRVGAGAAVWTGWGAASLLALVGLWWAARRRFVRGPGGP